MSLQRIHDLRETLSGLLVVKPFGEEQEAEVLAFIETLKGKSSEIVKQVLAEDSEWAQTPLELAIWANSLPIVKALIKLGAPVNVESIDSGNEINGDDKSMVALARHVAGEDSDLYTFVSFASGRCAMCMADAPFKCKRCVKVAYCGVECQRAHWPTHKGVCVPAGGAGAGAPHRSRRTVRRRTARRSRTNRRYTF